QLRGSPGQPLADGPVDLLGLGRSGVLARANGPDRFVRDGHGALAACQDLQEGPHLALHDLERATRLALLERLPNADDRSQPADEGGLDLLGYERVGLAEELPPLAVAHDDPRAPGLDQHAGADLARERPG